jgi:hypothetical protein
VIHDNSEGLTITKAALGYSIRPLRRAGKFAFRANMPTAPLRAQGRGQSPPHLYLAGTDWRTARSVAARGKSNRSALYFDEHFRNKPLP